LVDDNCGEGTWAIVDGDEKEHGIATDVNDVPPGFDHG
jgi:hypothetical protein